MTTPSEQLGTRAASDCLAGGGEMGERMRSLDWARTPLGPVEGWPQSLRTAVSICLNSKFPMVIWWGPELILLYNDGWIPILGPAKHPRALGSPGREIWPEIWDVIGPMFESVMTTGQATWSDDGLLLVNRYGYTEEAYFTWSYSPIRVESGGVGGVFTAVTETTPRVLGERRLQTLRALAEQATQAKTAEEACALAARTLAGNPHDLPFALLYLLDPDARQALLSEAVHLSAGTRASPAAVRFDGDDVWGLHHVLDTRKSRLVEDLEESFGRLPAGAWPDDWTKRALVLPLAKAGAQEPPAGFLVAGIGPRLDFDDDYRGFLELAAGQIATAIASGVRGESQEALRASEAKFSAAFGHSPLALTITSLADGRLVEVNEGFVRLSGYTREEALGRTPDEIGLWIDPEVRAERFARLRAGERVPNTEARFRIKSGEELTGVIGSAVVEINSRQCVLSSVTDITDRKKMEEALKEADQRKDEFLAMLAHELRNPLAPIRNAAQVLKLAGPVNAHQDWAREVIERQAQHLTRLVDDLLDVSRITRGKVTLAREPLDLATIVNRAVETSRPLIDARRHRLTVALPPEPVLLEGDLTRLVQVAGNLLNNAAKYTDEGGHIRLEAAREGGEVVLRVRDDGMGVPADLLPHLFDLFTQANRSLDRSQGGLGIGLTLVRQLVEMHGGRVEAKSDGLGRGSEFIVRLPAASSAAGAEGAAGERARPGASALKILIVEDNVDSADMLSVMLKLGGHEVRTAHDGPAALEAARSFQPQAVLCDIGLPGMNGYEVAARLRERPEFERTPLIALTGYGQEEARRRAREAGFDHHIVKPVEPDALAALLDSLRSAP
ncbi:MAG TPA: ATP-binding protein [Thermoanaerobaculia bacterium]